MKQTLISVVIPTYKRPQLLKKCLACLINQNFDKAGYEVIVVSDGPDAETKQATAELHHKAVKIKFLSLAAKKGPAAARNLGWQNANGILIAFTDDDCLPETTWLQNIWNSYHHETEIAFTGKVIVPVSKQPSDFELNTKGLETGEFVTANCVCTKTALQSVNGFDEAFTSAWREDSDLHFKLLTRQIPVIKLNDAIVIHPVREAPWGVSLKEQKKTLFNALLYKKHPLLYRQRIKSHPSWRYYFILFFFILFITATILKLKVISIIAIAGTLVLTSAFIIKRLSGTRKTFSHVVEMIVTSAAIPFLSIYWTIYGAIKYRILFF